MFAIFSYDASNAVIWCLFETLEPLVLESSKITHWKTFKIIFWALDEIWG
jgi:hypothetical protein